MPESEELADGGADELGLEAQQPTEIEAVEANVATDQSCRLDLRPRARCRADCDDGPEGLQPREGAGEELAADGIDDDVDAQILRQVGVDVRLLGAELAARLMPDSGSIVATASLAGLTATPPDPIYALTKHAVVGFVRSVAPQLAAQGIRINALCPGYADTPIVPDELRGVLGVPLIEPSFVAEAALQALNDEETGGAWVVQPNRIVQFRFPRIPGPR